MPTEQDFHRTPGVMTDIVPGRPDFDLLPADVGRLVHLVQGWMIHIFWAERYGVSLTDARRTEVSLRTVRQKLARMRELADRPLAEKRDPAQRLVGNCRDFSVMLAACLQHHGIPARPRCGFARYFRPQHFEDHWVCEYWHAGQERWILVDAQLDVLHQSILKPNFDPLDVPRDMFLVAGQAWQMCRQEQADPDDFGIFDLHGWWFIRCNLVRDLASLNGMPLLPWDAWGIMETHDGDLSDADHAALDRVAAITAEAAMPFDTVRALYESDERWRVPQIIRSYPRSGPETVDLSRL